MKTDSPASYEERSLRTNEQLGLDHDIDRAYLRPLVISLLDRVTALEAAAPRSRFTPPTAAEVEDYARSIGFSVDGQYFCDHYEKTGWVIGKAKIKSWQACVRTWKKNGAGGGVGGKGAVMR